MAFINAKKMKDNTLLYIGIGAAALYFIFKNNEQGPASAPQVTATNQGGATVLPTQIGRAHV